MAFNPEALLAHKFPAIYGRYVERDAILYALGIGLGNSPLDRDELRFLLETRLAVLPTLAVTLGTPGMWVREPALGINVAKLVHSAQSAVFHAELPPQADIVATARIISLTDRGVGKGAVVILERDIRDAVSGVRYCMLEQTLLLRGDGGFGGAATPRSTAPPPPGRAPDTAISYKTSSRAALIYRLSGDWNPLHADPEMARQAGFDRPILHGLASYGITGWVVLSTCGNSNPAALASLACRFSGTVFPGDSIDFAIWRDGAEVIFEAFVGDRKVLDQGHAVLR